MKILGAIGTSTRKAKAILLTIGSVTMIFQGWLSINTIEWINKLEEKT